MLVDVAASLCKCGRKLRLGLSFSLSMNYSVGVLNQRSNLCLPDTSEPEGLVPRGGVGHHFSMALQLR